MTTLQRSEQSVEEFLVNTYDTFLTISTLRDRQKELSQEQALLKSNEHLLASATYDNQQLKKMLGFERSTPLSLRAATVIARSAESWFASLTIDQGSEDGVQVNMPVICEQGLVGKVIRVEPHSSIVLSITAPQSKVNVTDKDTGDEGISVGRLHRPMLMQYVENTATIAEGDTIITSGISTLFPKGIPVGTVKSVRKDKYQVFQKVDITPSVTFGTLHYVFVVTEKKETVSWPEKN